MGNLIGVDQMNQMFLDRNISESIFWCFVTLFLACNSETEYVVQKASDFSDFLRVSHGNVVERVCIISFGPHYTRRMDRQPWSQKLNWNRTIYGVVTSWGTVNYHLPSDANGTRVPKILTCRKSGWLNTAVRLSNNRPSNWKPLSRHTTSACNWYRNSSVDLFCQWINSPNLTVSRSMNWTSLIYLLITKFNFLY